MSIAKSLIVTDPGKQGTFTLVPGSTMPDDGVMAIHKGANVYERVIDGPVNTALAGMKRQTGFDSAGALQSILQNAGDYEFYLPAGTFYLYSGITRVNKGGFTLRGAGPGKTKLVIMADVDGITITNPAGGNLGLIQLEDFTIVPGVAMSAGRRGIYVASQHEQQPGVCIRNVVVGTDGTHEYPAGLNLHDCSSNTIDNYAYNGAPGTTGVFTTTGLLIDNSHFAAQSDGTTGRPAVNYSISKIRMTGVGTGIRLDGQGSPALEGISISDARIVSCNYGLRATNTSYGATLIHVNDFHSEGYGPGIDIDGFTQVQTNQCLIYTDQPPSGVSAAPYSVRFNNPVNIRGNLEIIAFAPVACGVDLTGSGNSVTLDVLFSCAYGASHGVRNSAGVSNADLRVSRLYSGASGTPDTGLRVLDVAPNNARITGLPDDLPHYVTVTPNSSGVLDITGIVGEAFFIPATYTGTLTGILCYFKYKPITIVNEGKLVVVNGTALQLAQNQSLTLPPNSRLSLINLGANAIEVSHQSRRGATSVSASATADVLVTVDVSLYNEVVLFTNASHTLNLVLDKTNCNVGDDILVSRYDNSNNGQATVNNVDYATGGKVQGDDGSYAAYYLLPTASGSRSKRFILTSQGYWKLAN